VNIRLRIGLVMCLCGIGSGLGPAWALPPVQLEGQSIHPAEPGPQAVFRLLQGSAKIPVVQRLSARGTVLWLVQFHDPVHAEWASALESQGAIIHGYVPEQTLLVEAAPAAIAALAALASVTWIGEWLPASKQAPAVREWRPANAEESREFHVALFQAVDRLRVARELGELGVFVPRAELQTRRDWLRIRLTRAQVDTVATWGEVQWVEPAVKLQGWGSAGPAEAAVAEDPAAILEPAWLAGARIQPWIWGRADAGRYGLEARAIDRFVWEHPEMLVVAAAGNAAVDLHPADGVVDAGSIGTPATAKNVLSVGATEGRGNIGRVWQNSWPEEFAVEPIALDRMAQPDGPRGMAAFSGRGPCADGRIKPDLVAPGTFLEVPRPAGSEYTGWGVAADPDFISVGGTGVAAEHVAEIATKIREWLAAEREMAAPSAALLKALLIAGAQDLAPGQYGMGAKQEIPFKRPNSVQGSGLLANPEAATALTQAEWILQDEPGLATGQSRDYPLNLALDAGPVTVVLAYSDYPALPGVGRQRVNDLDLTVRTPAGAVLHPGGGTEPDRLNNVERIDFSPGEAGEYVVRVEARHVPLGGRQPYALVIRGIASKAAAPAATMENP
jgi:hypothetical protein